MKRSLIPWGLMLLAVGAPGAWAGKLDKSACNVLSAELAGMIADGTRDHMERGPEWAMANLPREKLLDIRRLIELEEQLEFRCGMSRGRVAATAPAKVEKVVIPEEPEKKPNRASGAAPANPVRTVAAIPATDEDGADKPATQKPAQKAAPAEPAAAKPASDADATAVAPPAKSSRRQSSSTYVSPSDVNPFFVTRYGDTQ